MATACGAIATILGALAMVAAIIRGARNERLESHQNEMSAIGWFILAALCFR